MLGVIGVHPAEEADVVRDGRQVRHQVGDHHAALAAGADGCLGAEGEEFLRADLGDFLAQGRVDTLAVAIVDEGFRIEEIDLRGAALHEEEDHPLGLGLNTVGVGRGRCDGRLEEVVKSKGTEAAGGALQHLTSANRREHGCGVLKAVDEGVR